MPTHWRPPADLVPDDGLAAALRIHAMEGELARAYVNGIQQGERIAMVSHNSLASKV